jgi:micrococcal nuclease
LNGALLIICVTLVAIDGDTIKCDGVNMRAMGDGAPFVSGFDTPEIWTRECQAELELGRRAKIRMQELLDTPGMKVYDSGEVDKTEQRRPLVWIVLPDGRTAGSILIEEGLARVWTPGYKADWCLGGLLIALPRPFAGARTRSSSSNSSVSPLHAIVHELRRYILECWNVC